MQIDWWTLALQALNFLVLVWLLWRFLYRPVREVIERRKELAAQAFTDADQQKSEAEAARQRFEEHRIALAQERQEMLKRMHEELEAERRSVLEAAHQEAEARLATAEASIEEDREAALAEVREEIAALAVEMASKLLRKIESHGSDDTALEQLERQLKNLSEDERERLKTDLAADGARLTVVTAAPLATDERDRWANRLGICLGNTSDIDFSTDPEILGGAELHFPHVVLKFTWADQLRKARALMGKDDASP